MAACIRPRSLFPPHVDAVFVRFTTLARPNDTAVKCALDVAGGGGTMAPDSSKGSHPSGRAVAGSRRRKRRSLHQKVGSDGAVDGAATNMFTVLGPLCRWRACLAQQTRFPPPRSLCSQHSHLRAYLESLPGGGQEVSRHLPRRPSDKKSRQDGARAGARKLHSLSYVKADYDAILESSSLLTELLNSKLSATIEGFCARAATAAREGKFKKSARRSSGSSGASSTRASGNHAASLLPREALASQSMRRRRLADDLHLSKQVEATERAVAAELRLLAQLKVFPSAELAAIRREYKVLDRERTALLQREERRQGGRAQSSEQPGARRRLRRRRGADKNEVAGAICDSSSADDDSSGEGDSGQKSKWRSEGELELEFCERKLTILRHRRKLADQHAQSHGFDEHSASEIRPRGGASAMRLHAARAFSRENY